MVKKLRYLIILFLILISGNIFAAKKIIIINIDYFNRVNKPLFYPNPSSSEIIITKDGVYQMSIFNLNGNVVFDKRINGNNVIDISELHGGLYIVQIKDNKDCFQSKLLINR